MGVMLYEALTGQLPFDGAPEEVLYAKQQGRPRPPSEIVDGVRPEHTVAREEIFGPCTSLITVDSLEEAIRVNNDVAYGLSSSIFTRDAAGWMRRSSGSNASAPPGPAMTISPSSTQRAGSCASSGAASSGK